MNNCILKKVIDIANFSTKVLLNQKSNYLIEAQDLLLNYLEKCPKDTDAWRLLIRIECNSPLYDHERIYSWCNSILSYDPSNIYAFLFLSYADYYITNNLDNELINKLSQAKSNQKDLLSLIEIAKARYWGYRKNDKEYEICLLKSINLCKDHITNYVMLAEFYIKHKKINLAIPLIKQAIVNRGKLLSIVRNDKFRITDMNNFLEDSFIDTEGISNELCNLIEEYDKDN